MKLAQYNKYLDSTMDTNGLLFKRQGISISSTGYAPVHSSCLGSNTLRPRQNCRHFPDDIFKCIFFNENVWIPINI